MYKLTDAVPRPRPIRGLAGRGSAVAQQLSIPYATGAASMHSHSLCSKTQGGGRRVFQAVIWYTASPPLHQVAHNAGWLALGHANEALLRYVQI